MVLIKQEVYLKENMWKNIRKKCMNCSGESENEVRLCPVLNCPLFPYRFGKADKRRVQNT